MAQSTSRGLIGRDLIFSSLTSPTCCNSPRKCTPVKYKTRQKAWFQIVSSNTSLKWLSFVRLHLWRYRSYHKRTLCPFDFRRKIAIQKQSLPTSFTDHGEKSLTRKLASIFFSTETKLKSNIYSFAIKKNIIIGWKQLQGLTLPGVTTLNRDEMIRQCTM